MYYSDLEKVIKDDMFLYKKFLEDNTFSKTITDIKNTSIIMTPELIVYYLKQLSDLADNYKKELEDIYIKKNKDDDIDWPLPPEPVIVMEYFSHNKVISGQI